MPSANYRHTGKVALALETTASGKVNELERLELEDGALRTTIVGSNGTIDVNIVSPDPLPVEITAPDPLNVNEAPYSSIYTHRFNVAYSLTGVGASLNAASVVASCMNFIVFAPNSNEGSVFIGSAADRCYIELVAGSSKSYSLTNADLLFFYGDHSGNADKIVIEFYDPVMA